MEEDVVLIARFDTPFEAEEARIALEEEEIECMITDELTGDLGLVGWSNPGGVKLLVRAEDVERAVAALAQTPAANDLVIKPQKDAGSEAEA
ncbi:MAG TPA: DUF2007 domain-containing protein [Planctomycetota bacterium]|nr:DUF2007 domain-containing protein [Planctomycetota bacterium]